MLGPSDERPLELMALQGLCHLLAGASSVLCRTVQSARILRHVEETPGAWPDCIQANVVLAGILSPGRGFR